MDERAARIGSALGVSAEAIAAVDAAEVALKGVFARIERVEEICAARVLDAFTKEGIAARHFAFSTGYGYDDAGRDALDRVFARALQAKDALVRPQFASGTHAIFTALAGLTEPGDAILSASGKPYDTLENAVGLAGDYPNSLKRMGVRFASVPLDRDGKLDTGSVLQATKQIKPKLLYVQRSRGYAWRDSFLPERDMAPLFRALKTACPEVIIVVDNCYGEFTGIDEPTAYGADIIMGSLIKNPGGGLAPTGGYIAGKEDVVERISHRFTVPGMGREVGSYAGSYRPFYQGLFLAPHVTAQALKSAALFARLFGALGYETMPAPEAARSDIVQAIRFRSADELIAFCKSIQGASPVDSLASPEPWDMPGYTSQVIMAAGAFVQGASIELSADAPIREPYTAYVQGALTYSHGKLAAMRVYDALRKKGG
ncbi:MAG TPA: methionine gamma-lyase family protein [Clostridia bacterium]|nr:methionine gamma-lyase family protein [Clostridia bacterium]